MNNTQCALASIGKLSQVVMLSAVLGMASSQARASDALIQVLQERHRSGGKSMVAISQRSCVRQARWSA